MFMTPEKITHKYNNTLVLTMKVLWRGRAIATDVIGSLLRLGRGVELQSEKHPQFSSALMMMGQDVELLKPLSHK